MAPQLAQTLGSAAVLGALIRPLLVATILVGLWQALKRAKLTPRQRLRAWVTVAVVLIGWLTLVWILAERAFFVLSDNSQMAEGGIIVVSAIVLVVGSLFALTRSETIAAAIDAAPLWWLIVFQVYRIASSFLCDYGPTGFSPDPLPCPRVSATC